MNRIAPQTSCDCTSETRRIAEAIERTVITPSPYQFSHPTGDGQAPQATGTATSLGDVLSAGRLIVRNWERLNTCLHADNHLDGPGLRNTIETIGSLLDLYEKGADAAGLFQAGDVPRGPSQIVASPVHLGGCMVDGEEALIVQREAMRHSLLLLGEVLHDIKRDLEDMDGERAIYVENARREAEDVTLRIVRLLGKVNE